MMTEKQQLRKQLRLKRDSLEDRNVLSDKICRLLLSTQQYKDCKSIFLYSATGSEVSADLTINQAFSDGKKVAFPKCIDTQGHMKFYFVSSYDDMVQGLYGIMEPPEDADAFFGNESTLCIVPGLSFSPDGYRIGYGKGYYDRFLSEFKGVSIGLCYDACLSENIPTDKYDKKVNYLITDKRIYNFT